MSDTQQLQNKLRYEADLERDSLGALLVKIYNYRVPGLIEATRAGVTKRLFLRDGNVIYATSTDPRDRLGKLSVGQEHLDSGRSREHRSSNAHVRKNAPGF